ncbi:TPA: opacity family porin [Neisseria meningitidis]|uniref:opacity family porin n=1 Tax=Neisseria meningitidis TaxID=487 RepID=UPI001A291B20|nr:outer membrane beta-barrel protein [Neisseria meningitidis]
MQPQKTFSSLLFSSLLFSSLLFSSAAQAASEDGSRSPYYVQADLAYAAERITHDYPEATGANNTSTVSDYFRNIRTHSIHPRVSVGYDFGGWRIAADYARYRKWNNNKYSVNTKNVQVHKSNGNREDLKTENQENGTFHAVSSLGLSAVYDFDTGSRFKPYAGVRVAYGHVRHSIDSTKKTTNVLTVPSNIPGGTPTIYNQRSTQNAYHESHSIRRLGLGVIAGVGFDITPKLTLDTGYRYHNWGRLENTRFKTHEVSLGMRYRF